MGEEEQPKSKWVKYSVFALIGIFVIIILVMSVKIYIKIGDISTSTNNEGTTEMTPMMTSSEPVSHAPGWMAAAAFFNMSMNRSANPCDDFFNYACGNWIKSHPIPKGGQSTGTAFPDLVYMEFNMTAKALSKIDQKDPKVTKAVKLAAQAFSICASSSPANYTGAKQVLDLITKYGGWPVLDTKWNASSAIDVGTLMGMMSSQQGVDTVVPALVDVDWRNVSRHIVYLDQAVLGLGEGSREIYLNKTFSHIVDAYAGQINDTIMALAKDMGLHLDPKVVMNVTMKIIEMEKFLAQINAAPTMRRNSSEMYNLESVDAVEKAFRGYFNWSNFFAALFPGMVIPGDAPVVLEERSYYLNLEYFFGNFSRLDGQNYLMWRLVNPQLQYMGNQYTDIHNEFQVKQAKPIVTAQEVNCASYLTDNMEWAMGRLFVDIAFNRSLRNDVSVMVDTVVNSVQNILLNTPWMDSKSKQGAQMKIQNLVRNIVYPDWIYDDKMLNKFYAGLNFDSAKSMFDVQQILGAFNGKVNAAVLSEPVDRTDFQMSPATMDAWYNPEYNSLTIPAGILQLPFWDHTFPMASNFGGIGVVMGHECTHGFDDEGVQFYYNGTLYTWMTEMSRQNFEKSAKCIINEYNGFCYKDLQMCVNGANTQGENIADNGGLKAAYYAYQNYVVSNGEEARLPGMEHLSMEQVFFLSYGKLWCGSETPDALRNQLLLNVHSPPKNRVNGALMNFGPFAEAFQCKAGDPMVPKHHCDVW